MSAADEVLTTPPPWREVFTGARGRLTIGLLLLEALVAIEALIVATILPAVEADLGGLSLYGWTFTAFTLAAFATVPIAGRVTDSVGPRPVLGVTVVLYAAGLLIAAAAPSMLVVVIGRFVQGIGGGGLYTVSLAAVAKTYPDRIRPRVMALLASMWILPGLIGPAIGSVVAETIGWRWAFLGPIPAIVVGVLLVMPSLVDIDTAADEERLPIASGLLLMLGAGIVLAGLTELTLATWVLVPVGLVDRGPRAPPRRPRRDPVRAPRAPRRRDGGVPRLVRLHRRRRVHHADARARAGPVRRTGGVRDRRRGGLVGGG